jgi:hypothetical protein
MKTPEFVIENQPTQPADFGRSTAYAERSVVADSGSLFAARDSAASTHRKAYPSGLSYFINTRSTTMPSSRRTIAEGASSSSSLLSRTTQR